jgi:hypothetical protein
LEATANTIDHRIHPCRQEGRKTEGGDKDRDYDPAWRSKILPTGRKIKARTVSGEPIA